MPAPAIALISEGFGTGDGGKTYPIPVPSQIGITPGAASFTDGFPPLTRTALGAGGIPPSGEDMNGLLYQMSGHLALINSGQPYRFNSVQAAAIGGYDIGALLLNTAGDGFWLNLSAANSADPDAGGAGWVPVTQAGYYQNSSVTGGTITLTPTQSAKPLLFFGGTLTGNATIKLPINTYQQWIVINNTAGGFTLTVAPATGGGTGVVVPQTGAAAPTTVYSDGVNIQNTGVSTAGLAPLNSPAFTGTPTGPTAGASTNTTQLGTTAFVQAAIALATAALAPKASPVLTGVPTAPTPSLGDNSAKLATTAFVQAAVSQGQNLLANGYFKFSGGLIIQWGRHSSAANTTTTIPYNIPFPTAALATSITNFALGSYGTSAALLTAMNANNFTVVLGPTGSGYDTMWIAVGH